MSDSAYGIKFIRFTVEMDDGSTYEMVLDTPEKVEAIAGIAWGPVNGKENIWHDFYESKAVSCATAEERLRFHDQALTYVGPEPLPEPKTRPCLRGYELFPMFQHQSPLRRTTPPPTVG